MKTHRHVHLLAASLLVGAAACSNDRVQPLTQPTRPSFASALSTCDFRAMQADARTYFGSGNNPVFDEIKSMSNACKAGDVAGTIDYGFNVLAWMAKAARGNVQKGTPTDGAALALDVLAFDTSLDPTLPSSDELVKALDRRGLFEVRGKNMTYIGVNESTDAIFSRDAIKNQVPAWGASPTPSGNWTGGTRFLAYGYPLLLSDILTNEQPIAYGFDMNRYPAGAFPANVITGVCVAQNGTDRIQHNSAGAGGTQFLPFASLPCNDSISTTGPVSPTASVESGQPGRLARMLARAWDAFAPRTAWAALTSIGGVGGLGSSWSPHIGVNLISVNLSIASGYPIADGYISQPILDTAGNPIRIAVKAAGGSGLAGVAVTVSVKGNNGTNVALSLDGVTWTPTVTRVTDALGVADFTGLQANKAGGYTLIATGGFDGIAGATFTSNLFNLQNK